MSRRKASCVYRGNTFYCDYDAAGIGADREIRVCYNGDERRARSEGQADEALAAVLLEELVTLASIAITVAAGARAAASRMGDGSARRAA